MVTNVKAGDIYVRIPYRDDFVLFSNDATLECYNNDESIVRLTNKVYLFIGNFEKGELNYENMLKHAHGSSGLMYTKLTAENKKRFAELWESISPMRKSKYNADCLNMIEDFIRNNCMPNDVTLIEEEVEL